MDSSKSLSFIVKLSIWGFAALLISDLVPANIAVAQPLSITLDGNNVGQTFDGIGAVSAGRHRGC